MRAALRLRNATVCVAVTRGERQTEDLERWGLSLASAFCKGSAGWNVVWTHEPLLSQLARVTDISQSRIEIQKHDLTCTRRNGANSGLLLHSDPRSRAFALHLAARARMHFRQRFREDNALLLEDTRRISKSDSVQRSWIVIGRKAVFRKRPTHASRRPSLFFCACAFGCAVSAADRAAKTRRDLRSASAKTRAGARVALARVPR